LKETKRQWQRLWWKTGQDVKKVGGKVAGGISDKYKEEDNNDNKRPHKRCSNRKKCRVDITELGR